MDLVLIMVVMIAIVETLNQTTRTSKLINMLVLKVVDCCTKTPKLNELYPSHMNVGSKISQNIFIFLNKV